MTLNSIWTKFTYILQFDILNKKDTRNCIFFVVIAKLMCYYMAYDLTKGD